MAKKTYEYKNEAEGVEESPISYTSEEAKLNWIKIKSDMPLIIQTIKTNISSLGTEVEFAWDKLLSRIEKAFGEI